MSIQIMSVQYFCEMENLPFEKNRSSQIQNQDLFRFRRNRYLQITKIVISQKLQRIEQSYLEARFAIFESNQTGPNYRVGNFRFLKTNNLSFLKNFEKSQKSHISKTTKK